MSLLGRPEPIMPMPWARSFGLLAIGFLVGQFPYRFVGSGYESMAGYAVGYALVILFTAAACAGIGLLIDLAIAQVKRWQEGRADRVARLFVAAVAMGTPSTGLCMLVQAG